MLKIDCEISKKLVGPFVHLRCRLSPLFKSRLVTPMEMTLNGSRNGPFFITLAENSDVLAEHVCCFTPVLINDSLFPSVVKRNGPLCTLLLSILILRKGLPGPKVILGVLMMSVGCIIAASGDITFDLEAYAFGELPYFFKTGFIES